MSGMSNGKVELDIRHIMAELGVDGTRFINELLAADPVGEPQSDTTLPNNGAHRFYCAML